MTLRTVSSYIQQATHFSNSFLRQNWSRSIATSTFSGARALDGYQRLLESSERQKVIAIAKSYLSGNDLEPFLKDDNKVSMRDLFNLLRQVNKVATIPIQKIGDLHEDKEFIHFRDNFTFVNLPYSEKASAWSDRNALQQLIREKFPKIFKPGDVVVIPGCADGQIAIEVYAQALTHNTELEVVAADFNRPAMQLGYLTMQAFGLDPDRIQWIQSDIKSKNFFDWLGSRFYANGRHQIVTLVQPSLRETSLLAFLAQGAHLHKLNKTPTTVIMPVLLEDQNSGWFRTCDDHVQRALKASKQTQDLPQLVWKKTKYGHEMLRLDPTKTFYLPQQYFIRPDALPEIQKETGYLDQSEQIFDEVSNKEIEGKRADPRLIEGTAKRVFCVWNALD